MTKTILYIPKTISHFMDLFAQEKLGYFLLGSMLVSAMIYISGLNMAITETFGREKILSQTNQVERQISSRNEFFVSKISEFYAQNAASFDAVETFKPQFVNRGGASVAQAGATAIH